MTTSRPSHRLWYLRPKCAALNGGEKNDESPLLFLALGDRIESRASFYDFVMWYLRGQNAGLYFDGENTYSFCDDKENSTSIEFPEEEGDHHLQAQ